ncbi:transglutaminase-like domain-containing protein [Cohnella abietis]|uniref:Transglutaminase-like domain-containing protein n=1 Tax=Cohnella abietis TaxID=2507935 RepID=A0A3T1D4V6_9BACL|nr:transglutaminase-like domain-containing protein [Cohnella abietis]BBI33127.1 hypothetical protein KCTCHS21_25260 [Cohnella abietis]
MRRSFLILIAVCFISLFSAASTYAAEGNSDNWLDETKLDSGLVGVSYDITKGSKLKVLIKKGNTTYTYDLNQSNKFEYFSLQSDNGTYNISVLQNTSGTKYKLLQSKDITLNLQDSSSAYVGSIQNINWNESELATKKAAELTKNKASDEEKVKAIYEFIISEIKYDSNLAKNVTSNYIPNIDNVFKAKKGICYDYSTLFAAMTRSVGIPTKLVMGTSEYVKEYHAWNNVYINGKWITIDTTVDAALSGKKAVTMNKDSSKYVAAKVY